MSLQGSLLGWLLHLTWHYWSIHCVVTRFRHLGHFCSWTSNGYNLAIGLFVLLVDVQTLAEWICPSAPLFTSSITASFHCTLGASSWIRTMSPTFTVCALFPMVRWNLRSTVRYSVFHLCQKWASICAWTLALLLMSSMCIYIGSVNSSSWTS